MQIPSLGQSGYQLLQRSNQQAAESAQEIASAVNHTPPPNEPTEVGSGQTAEVESSESGSVTDALVGLQQAEHYTRAGVKVLQAEDATLGRLLDIQV